MSPFERVLFNNIVFELDHDAQLDPTELAANDFRIKSAIEFMNTDDVIKYLSPCARDAETDRVADKLVQIRKDYLLSADEVMVAVELAKEKVER